MNNTQMVIRKRQESERSSSVFDVLSERAYNALVMSRLDTLPAFLSYYKRFGDFIQLRHTGEKTNKELILLAQHLLNYNSSEIASNPSENGLSEKAVAIYHKMPMRARNVLQLNGITSPDAFLNHYKEHGSFSALRHCGAVTNDNLIRYAAKMQDIQQECLPQTG